MNTSNIFHIKTYLLLLLMILFGSLGDILLSKGMKQIGEISNWSIISLLETFGRVFTSSTMWLGIGSLVIFFVSYVLTLSWADYSYVSPASAMSFAVVPLLGYTVLGEALSPIRWAGVGLIFLGVVLISRTPHRTTREDASCVQY